MIGHNVTTDRGNGHHICRPAWRRWAFIGYTGLTILLYVVWVAMSGEWVAPLGPIDKGIEIVLVALLWRDRG